MKIGQNIGTILKLALVGGCIYAFVNWGPNILQDGEHSDYAEQSCVDEIAHRFAVSTVNVYAVNETNAGYVVRASVTLARGTPAKVYCLTNEHGGVKEVMIEEQ